MTNLMRDRARRSRDAEDLARSLCQWQFEIFINARPFNAATAKLALQPIVNLARLHIRDGHGDQAHQLLEALNEAVTSRTDTVVNGLPVPVATLTEAEDDHQELRRWLWTILLADGTRALTLRRKRWEPVSGV